MNNNFRGIKGIVKKINQTKTGERLKTPYFIDSSKKYKIKRRPLMIKRHLNLGKWYPLK